MRRLALAALCALASGGCVDFADPLTPWTPGQAAQAHVFMQLTQPAEPSMRASLFMSARIFAGTDEGGRHHPFVRESFEALGALLDPTEVKADGWRSYSRAWQLAADSVADTELGLGAPGIDGIAGAAPSLVWRSIARDGPGVVTVNEGEPVVLRIKGYDKLLQPAPTFQRWTIDLMGPRGTFNLGSNGLPSPVTRIPADWLPARAGETAIVQMTLTRNGSFAAPPGDYPASVLLMTTIRWTVQVVAP